MMKVLTPLTFDFPYSYACDDYVINETQSKSILRALEHFQNNQTSPKTSKRKEAQKDAGLTPVSITENSDQQFLANIWAT